jgi:hypothetical protein
MPNNFLNSPFDQEKLNKYIHNKMKRTNGGKHLVIIVLQNAIFLNFLLQLEYMLPKSVL